MVEFGAGGQAFHIAAALYGATANPVAALYGLGKTEIFQQGTDYPDGKAITGTHGVDTLATGTAGTNCSTWAVR